MPTNVTMAAESRLRRRIAAPDVLSIALFVCALLAPLVDWAVHGIPQLRRLPEERMSSALPPAPSTLADVSSYPQRLQAWFDDSMGLRENLLCLRSRVHASIFHVSPTSQAILGRDSWVFSSGGPEQDSFRGGAPVSTFEIELWVNAIDARRRWCNARGIEYVFLLAPTKESVYADRHPLGPETIGPTPLEQLARKFEGDDAFVDVRPAIVRAKSEDREHDHAYFPLGTHWTDRGAKCALALAFDRLRARPKLSALQPIADEDLTWAPDPVEGDTWAGRLYLRGVLEQSERSITGLRGDEPRNVSAPGEPFRKKVTEFPHPELPSILCFHDSFGEALEPLLARRASRCTSMWHSFDPGLVEDAKPDLVLEVFVESVLYRPPVENLREQSEAAQREFDASPTTTYVLDAARDASILGKQAAIEAEAVGTALRVHWTQPAAVPKLPTSVLPPTQHTVVRIDIAAPAACDVHFFYLKHDGDPYTRRNSFTKTLAAGDNRVYLDLGLPGIRGPIAFGSTTVDTLTLTSCEARVVP